MDRFSDDYRPSSRRRGPDALEDGLDRLVTAGRQLVDGVSGARPGSRRRSGSGAGGGAALPRLGELGRWVEERLDGLLDADDDGWREPWQEPSNTSQRRPLDAISRRGRSQASAAQAQAAWPQEPSPDDQDWPDDEAFSVPRWQRAPQAQPREQSLERQPDRGAARPLPRSSRQR